MLSWIILLIVTCVCILTVEAFSWTHTTYSHCKWLVKGNINVDRRKTVSYKSICTFSVLSGVLSFFAWLSFIYFLGVTTSSATFVIIISLIIAAFQLITIHSWYMISSFINVPIEFVPFVSRHIILTFKRIVKNSDFIEHTTLNTWHSVFDFAGSKTSLIENFLNIVPDFIWVKDVNNRFVYVNRQVVKKMLLADNENEVIGKTSKEISIELRDKGIDYTYGDICEEADNLTKERRCPTLFFHEGYINNTMVALRALRSPVFNDNKEIVGTIGIARDVSRHIEMYNKISDMFKDNEYKEGASLFLAYKQEFEALRDIKDIELFKEGMR